MSTAQSTNDAKYRHGAFKEINRINEPPVINGVEWPCCCNISFEPTYGSVVYTQTMTLAPNYADITYVNGIGVGGIMTLGTLPTKFESELIDNAIVRNDMYKELGVLGAYDGMDETSTNKLVSLINKYLEILPTEEVL
jgi:hypothetical protein